MEESCVAFIQFSACWDPWKDGNQLDFTFRLTLEILTFRTEGTLEVAVPVLAVPSRWDMVTLLLIPP